MSTLGSALENGKATSIKLFSLATPQMRTFGCSSPFPAPDLVRVLPVLLRLVRHRAVDGGGARRRQRACC